MTEPLTPAMPDNGALSVQIWCRDAGPVSKQVTIYGTPKPGLQFSDLICLLARESQNQSDSSRLLARELKNVCETLNRILDIIEPGTDVREPCVPPCSPSDPKFMLQVEFPVDAVVKAITMLYCAS